MENPLNFEIRPTREDDRGLLLEVYQACEDFLALGPQPRATMEMVEADIRLSRQEGGIYCGIFYGPVGQQKMIGVLDYVPGSWEGCPDQAFIELLMIIPSFRSQGIGEQVVRWLERKVQVDHQVTVIKAGVQVNNPAAVRFWQKFGYVIISGPEFCPDQTIVYNLRKSLAFPISKK